MVTKCSYTAKLDILNAMSTKITGLRDDLARLNNHEMLAADPAPSEFCGLVEFLGELEDEVDGVTLGSHVTLVTEPMAFFER